MTPLAVPIMGRTAIPLAPDSSITVNHSTWTTCPETPIREPSATCQRNQMTSAASILEKTMIRVIQVALHSVWIMNRLALTLASVIISVVMVAATLMAAKSLPPLELNARE